MAVDIHFTDEFESFLEMLTGFLFQFLDGDGHRNVGRYFDLYVDVVFGNIGRVYVKCGVFLDGGIETLDEFLFGVLFEILSAILGAPDYLILMLIDAVV